MSSKQSEAVRRRWGPTRLALVQPGSDGPDDESWGDLTAAPREVDYLETEAGGRPAMWAVPKRSYTDRVLLCMHGAGFVSGSIYTHRKMFGHLAKAPARGRYWWATGCYLKGACTRCRRLRCHRVPVAARSTNRGRAHRVGR